MDNDGTLDKEPTSIIIHIRSKSNKCNLLGDGYHIYRVFEHMNDCNCASFKEIGSYLEILRLYVVISQCDGGARYKELLSL
jgi:hypothetical protein